LKIKLVSFAFVHWGGGGVGSLFVSVCDGVLDCGGLHVSSGLVSLVFVGADVGTASSTAVADVFMESIFCAGAYGFKIFLGSLFSKLGK
jgi:hypothetical protein